MTNTNPKILIVEDDHDSCDAMLRVLEAAGYKTETASDSETAFESLSKQHPDILISDIQLPGMNGIELLKRAKTANDVEVILITGQATIEIAVEAVKEGA